VKTMIGIWSVSSSLLNHQMIKHALRFGVRPLPGFLLGGKSMSTTIFTHDHAAMTQAYYRSTGSQVRTMLIIYAETAVSRQAIRCQAGLFPTDSLRQSRLGYIRPISSNRITMSNTSPNPPLG
jgi:hypothetical protein